MATDLMNTHRAVGDVVQISPDTKSAFGGCFMLVTEPKPWGAQGFICMPGERGAPPAEAYYRAKHDEMKYIGRAAWVPQLLQEAHDRQ